MSHRFSYRSRVAAIALTFTMLAGCSPTFDWREVRGTPVPYLVMLPAKPASFTRPVNIGGITVQMTMTAAEVEGITFAVGTAEMPDAASAPAALEAMKEALVRNISGTIQTESRSSGLPPTIDIEAVGVDRNGAPRLLLARFLAREQRVYQLVSVGPQARMPREAADTFFASFQPAP